MKIGAGLPFQFAHSTNNAKCMRKLLSLGLLICLFTLSITLLNASPWGAKALRVRWDEKGGYPTFIRFKEGMEPNFMQVYPLLKEALALGDEGQMRLSKSQVDQLGYVHYEFQQLHAGFPVTAGIYRVHTRNGLVVSMNGRIFRNPALVPAVMPEGQALVLALAHVGAQSYKWELPAEADALRYALRDPNAAIYPEGKLTWVAPAPLAAGNPTRLAWAFDIYAHEPLSRSEVYVDVESGEIIFEHNKIHTADSVGTANTFYSGMQSLTTDFTGTHFRLRETGRASGVETYNMLNGNSHAAAVDFLDSNNVWDIISPATERAGTDGHWGAEMTHDYFWLRHGRSSFDGNGSALLSYINYRQNYSNAFWDGTRMTYGSGGGNTRPFCALDVVGHEFSHGVTGTSAGLIYQDESGALNESFSDIFGACIERYARPNDNDWEIGEDLGGIRDMADPSLFNNPDTYFGTFWTTGAADNGGVHNNSGVQNYWFYLMSEGGSGTNDNGANYNLSGMGIDTASMVAFRNLTVYLTPADGYADARYFAIESAIDLFGSCTPKVIETINAWHAVGVGNPYTGVLEAAFYTPDTNNCQFPATVQFQNNSLSALGYLWYFGDGDSSYAENPAHVYTSAGTYTVTLIAFGCNNEIDTIVLPNHVVLDPNAPCVINMPGAGEIQTHTGCSGELYDSGGASNYVDGSFSTTVIQVPGGNVLTAVFQSFRFRAGDLLKVYDGDTSAAPLIGVFGGNNLPAPIVSTGNSLTFIESTNSFGNEAGFHLTWSCAVGTTPAQRYNFDLVPNPAQSSFRFGLPSNSPAYSYSLLDQLGRVVHIGEGMGGREVQVDVKDLPRGVYFVRVDVQGARMTKRLVLQ